MNTNPRIRGKITKVNKEKGYGFITSKEKPFVKIFFYWEELKPTSKPFLELEKHMEVEFDLINWRDSGQWRAIRIEVIEK